MIAIKSSDELAKLIGNLAADITKAHVFWKLRSDLYTSFLVHPKVRHQSPTFWYLTLTALESSAILHLSRAFDQEASALHLHNWLSTIQANLRLFHDAEFRKRKSGSPFVDSLAAATKRPRADTLKRDIAKCSKRDPIVKRLIQYRHNALAHRSATLSLSTRPLADHLDLTIKDIEALLARADKILNRYSGLFSADYYSHQMIGHDDYEFVFKSVEAEVLRLRAGLKLEAKKILGAAAADEIYGDEDGHRS